MIFFDDERASDSPFVERVWRSHSEGVAHTAATRSQVKPTWLTPKCSPRSSSTSFRNNTIQGVEWTSSNLLDAAAQVLRNAGHNDAGAEEQCAFQA
jgi:hypothetical protein